MHQVMGFLPHEPDWSSLTPIRTTGGIRRVDDTTAEVNTTAGPLTVTLTESDARLRFGHAPRHNYGLLTETRRPLPIEIVETASGWSVGHRHGTLHIAGDVLAFTFTQAGRTRHRSATDGHFARRFRLPPFARLSDGWIANLELPSGESVYGLGEKWGPLDRRGQLVHSFNHDALGVNAERSYKNVPAAWSTGGWGLLVHTAGPVVHAVGLPQWSHRAYGLYVKDEVLDLFLFSADTGTAFLKRFADLAGPTPVPPLWSTGVILSKAYYLDADELLDTAREARKRKMPCDVITLDGRAWQDTDTRFAFEWCKRRYPEPRRVLDALHALDFRVCVWEYPLVSVKNPLFEDLAQRGWLLKDRRTGEAYRYTWEREPFGDVLTPLPQSGLLDFTHPEAYAYWRDRHRELFELGVDMIKADFGEQVQDHMLAQNGAAGDALHNVYAYLYNRCVYEAAERYAPNGAFLFSRAAWLGSHRYPSHWGGDPQADWEGLAASLRGGLSWGLSGGLYYATDVGGFYGDTRDPHLYVRWLQASVYSAHIRLHGIGPREPWAYGAEAEAAAMAALRRRYRLIPYLRAAMREAATLGLPVQRAMSLACPDDPAAWRFDTQFFCGPDLLVAPCLNPAGRVEVYLPPGDWIRFPSGERHAGGRIERFSLPLHEDCVFARAGAKIPIGPAVEHTGQLSSSDGDVEHTWSAS